MGQVLAYVQPLKDYPLLDLRQLHGIRHQTVPLLIEYSLELPSSWYIQPQTGWG